MNEDEVLIYWEKLQELIPFGLSDETVADLKKALEDRLLELTGKEYTLKLKSNSNSKNEPLKP